MATDIALPLTITIAQLPVGFSGTPQELADAIAERIEITAQQAFALFSVGATEPSSDIGPWAKDGNTWYYFDADIGSYTPFIIPQSSLGYQISQAEPTDDLINFWIQTDSDGQPLAINLKVVSGAGAVSWVSIYYLKSETYTKTEADLAIIQQNRYATKAKPNADQNAIDIDAADHKLTFNAELLDPGGNFTAADSRYIAPVKGIFKITGEAHFDNGTGTPAGMEIRVNCWSNGVTSGVNNGGNQTNVASPPNSRWVVPINLTFQADSGDFFELAMNATDGVNTGNLNLIAAESHWSVELVQTVA